MGPGTIREKAAETSIADHVSRYTPFTLVALEDSRSLDLQLLDTRVDHPTCESGCVPRRMIQALDESEGSRIPDAPPAIGWRSPGCDKEEPNPRPMIL